MRRQYNIFQSPLSVGSILLITVVSYMLPHRSLILSLLRAVDIILQSLPTIPLFSLLLRTDSESRVVNVLFRLFGINGLIIHGNLYRDGQCTATMHSLFQSLVYSINANISLLPPRSFHTSRATSLVFCVKCLAFKWNGE